ncbi:phytochelatin synthase family protein [Microcoleus sp. Pol14C2]|uniref:phytochelatin synthase family protein n=1 Tax=unclassified Microcoleus TaxID=2642155 RepID=UPI002FCE89ED
MIAGTLHSVNGVSDKNHSYARQSKSQQDFQPLSAHIETPKRRAYCGAASSVMVLNALHRLSHCRSVQLESHRALLIYGMKR